LGYGEDGVIVRVGPCTWGGCRLGDNCTEIRVESLKTKVTTTINRSPSEFDIIEGASS
jgi:hypothetical protein